MRNRRSSLVAGRLLVAIAIGLACSVAAPLSCHAQAVQNSRPSSISADGTQFSPRLLAIPVAAVFGASVYAIHADREWHHEYIGATLLLSKRRWVQWVGLAIMADDAAQHLIQTRRPSYRSPLHQAYAVTLYRWTR